MTSLKLSAKDYYLLQMENHARQQAKLGMVGEILFTVSHNRRAKRPSRVTSY